MILLKAPRLPPLLELELQVIVLAFVVVTPEITKGSLEQFVKVFIPTFITGFFWTVTTLLAETEAQGAFPKAVTWIVKEVISFEPGVYWVTSWLAFANNPFEVPIVDHKTEELFVAVADAVKIAPWQTTPVGAVVTVGAFVILIVISLKSVKGQFAVLEAVNLKVTEPLAISAALKV